MSASSIFNASSSPSPFLPGGGGIDKSSKKLQGLYPPLLLHGLGAVMQI